MKLTLHFSLPRSDTLRVTTFGADTLAESSIKTFEEFSIRRDDLQAKSAEIEGLLRYSASDYAAPESMPRLRRLEQLGADLYCELIPLALREKLDRAAGGDLLLSIDSSLVSLPWEFLFDGKGFFCRRYALGRIIDIPPSARRREKRALTRPIRFLSVADPRGDLPGAFDEGLRIRDLLLGQGTGAEPVLLARRVTVADLLDGLRRCDMLHYAGHVDPEQGSPSLRMADGSCSAARIEESAGRHPFPTLVFINGCRSSADAGSALAGPHGGQGTAHDLASSFLLCGARHFVGTQGDVLDPLAAEAGPVFFKALFSGEAVGASLAAARQVLLDRFQEASMAWAGFVLYGDPSFQLGSALRPGERWLREMARFDEHRGAYLKALAAGDPRERFVAAVALFQGGDRRGVETILEEAEVLYGLLRSPSVDLRRQGALLLEILAKDKMGYHPEDGDSLRERSIEQIRSWFESGEASRRLA